MVIPKPLLRPFEEEIIRKWRGEEVPEMWRFGTTAVSPKAEWIKGFLAFAGSAYVKQMFQEWRNFCERALKIPGTPRFRVGTYASFRNYIRVLSKLNLVRLEKIEPTPRTNIPRQFQRHYYALNMAKIDAPEWKHPVQSLYGSTNWADPKYFPPDRKRAVRKAAKEKRKKKRAEEKLKR